MVESILTAATAGNNLKRATKNENSFDTTASIACADRRLRINKDKKKRRERQKEETLHDDRFVISAENQNTKDKTMEKQGAPWLACIARAA